VWVCKLYLCTRRSSSNSVTFHFPFRYDNHNKFFLVLEKKEKTKYDGQLLLLFL
jgi:hypothetical protein